MSVRVSLEANKRVVSGGTFVPQKPRYSFADLILPQQTMDEIMQALAVRDLGHLIYEEWGLGKTHRLSHKVGINLYGPPGTGKTMAAHAIADYFQKDLLIVNYADIESKYVGDTPKNLTTLFWLANQNECVLFFDEADAILNRRLARMESATDVSVNQTRSVLLTLLNEYDGVVLFATNLIANYDPAFMRRILTHIQFTLPDRACRHRLFAKYIPPELPTNAHIDKLAALSEGMSGSEIANAVLLAAFKGARSPQRFVEHALLVEALASIKASRAANGSHQGNEQRGKKALRFGR